MTEDTNNKQPQWAIVELFGHNKVAGQISEEQYGGGVFVRVDVPAVDDKPTFTKLYGANAIYGITFVDESVALEAARSFRDVPYVPLRDPRRPGLIRDLNDERDADQMNDQPAYYDEVDFP